MDEIEKKSYIFIADAMLGKIARKLRLLGFDTIYKSNIDDEEVIDISLKEKRIILTGDRNLFAKSVKMNINSVLLDRMREIDNLLKIFLHLNIKYINFSPFYARCTICNNTLTVIFDKDKIKKKNVVPPFILNTINSFFICDNCNKIYWNGSHIKYMANYIEKINLDLSKIHKQK